MIFEDRNKNIEMFYSHSFDFPVHMHSNVEMLICTDGTYDLLCNDTRKTLHPGDVMIAFPGDIHAYYNTNFGEGLMIFFNPELSDILCQLLKDAEYENFVNNSDIIPIAKKLFSYYNDKSNFTVIYGLLHTIVGLIVKKTDSNNKRNKINTFSSIIKFIALNYEKQITLKSLSKQFAISQSHLSRIFSEKCSGGFKQYLNMIRLEKAKFLLCNTDNNIYEIMMDVGFQDQGTFNRVFKRYIKCTPREYKNSHNHH